jgi:hypothetical protein
MSTPTNRTIPEKNRNARGGGFPAVETTRSQREVERLYREARVV